MKQEHTGLQSSIVILLALIAAAWLGLSSIKILHDPSSTPLIRQSSFDFPDTSNSQLDQLQAALAPIDRYLPLGAPLRYVSQGDLDYTFEYVQAVLSPRRIGPDAESSFIFVYARPDEWPRIESKTGNARLLVKLLEDVAIFKKDSRD